MDQNANRFLSLDVFRGMTICFMIIVNTPGSGAAPFPPLEHAAWFGFTPTDLVFPSFLFAVGNAMSFSQKKFIGMGTGSVLWRIFKRAAIIFLLGFLMYWFPFVQHNAGGWSLSPISTTRIFGVLQRIALCYLFASLLIHFISSKTAIIVISALLLLGYWVLLLIFGDNTAPYGMLTNAGTYLDKALLGDAHLYHGEGVAFDPEGILSTLPAIVNVIVGYYAGKFIQEKGKGFETISKLMLYGFLFIFLALCWNMSFPIAKKLWTSSFVLLTVGIDLVWISALIYIVEIKAWNKANWTSFFTTVGKNPLPIYIFSELFVVILFMINVHGTTFYGWINQVLFQVIAPGAIGSLLFAICYMLVCWTLGKILDKNKIYIRV
ncbi:MAG: acyltransferase family protein [Sphingobacteriales bacterium]